MNPLIKYAAIDVTTASIDMAVVRGDGQLIKQRSCKLGAPLDLTAETRGVLEEVRGMGEVHGISLGLPGELIDDKYVVPVGGGRWQTIAHGRLSGTEEPYVLTQPRIVMAAAHLSHAPSTAFACHDRSSAPYLTPGHTIAVIGLGAQGIEVVIRKASGKMLVVYSGQRLWTPQGSELEAIAQSANLKHLSLSFNLLLGEAGDVHRSIAKAAEYTMPQLNARVLAQLMATLVAEHPGLQGFVLLDSNPGPARHWLQREEVNSLLIGTFTFDPALSPMARARRAQMPIARYIGDENCNPYLMGGITLVRDALDSTV